jgi:ABC-type multidrug transport system permease subunit
MTGSIRMVRKELIELFMTGRGLAFAFLLPCVVVYFVGQLQSQRSEVTVLLAGMPECGEERSEHTGACALDWIADFASGMRVVSEAAAVEDPLGRLRASPDIDLLINVCTGGEDIPELYSTVTGRSRTRRVLAFAKAFEVHYFAEPASWAGCETGADATGSNAEAAQEWSFEDTAGVGPDTTETGNGLAELALAPDAPPRLLRHLHPQVTDPQLALLPMTIALISCFLPFMLAAPSIVRESERGTLDVLFSLPTVGARSVLVGKAIAPVCVTVVSTFLLLLVAEWTYGLQIKPGISQFGGILIAAALGSTLIGLAVSSLAKTGASALLASTYYFFALILFGGFFFPVEEAAWPVRAVSMLLPLTHLKPEVEAWMFGAPMGSASWNNAGRLVAQCAVYAALAWATFLHFRRRF